MYNVDLNLDVQFNYLYELCHIVSFRFNNSHKKSFLSCELLFSFKRELGPKLNLCDF